MVGHTHEDIDQFFSCIARILNKFKVLTLSQLIQKIKQVNRKDPVEAEILDHLYNIRDWIDGFTPDLQGHLKSYQFKLEVEGEECDFRIRRDPHRRSGSRLINQNYLSLKIFQLVNQEWSHCHLRRWTFLCSAGTYGTLILIGCHRTALRSAKRGLRKPMRKLTVRIQQVIKIQTIKMELAKKKILNLQPLLSWKNRIFSLKIDFSYE